MQIILYQTKSETNKINKTLSAPLTLNVVRLLDDTSIMTPIIDVRNSIGNLSAKNYAYIQAFQRYYFINSYEILSNEIVRLHLTVDVLMSFKNDINNLSVIAERSTNKGNVYLNDEQYPTLVQQNRTVYRLSNGLFYPHLLSGSDSRNYVLTLINKGATT